MKTYRILAVFACAGIFSLHADPQEVFARSYMYTRPAYQHLSTQQALFHNFIHEKKGTLRGAMQLYAIFQRSQKLDKTARYFIPNCKENRKNCLLVSGDDNMADKLTRDIRAEWLGLPPNFRGTMKIDPEQEQNALVVEYNQDLGKFSDSDTFRHWWVSIAIPIVMVSNKLNLQQFDVINKGTASPRDIIEAFDQAAWNFGKITCERREVEIAEIKLRFGGSYLTTQEHQLDYYSSLIIPIGSKQNPEFLFDAITGTNGHIAINAGVNFQFLLNRDTTKYSICFFLGLEDIWQIRNAQCRTVDLKQEKNCVGDLRQRQWSRYMLYKRQDNPGVNVPGVNLMTFEMVVRPYNIVDFSMGWRIKAGVAEFEIGYGVWGHDQEKIKLRTIFKPFFGIAGTGNNTASGSTINNRADDDAEFTLICPSDLDLCNGGASSALNHKVHASLGFGKLGKRQGGFFGAGFYADFPQKNSALKNWGAWAKVGGSF